MNLHKNFIINAALCCLILGMMWSIGMPRAAAQYPVALSSQLSDAIKAQYPGQFTSTDNDMDRYSQADFAQITSLTATDGQIQSIIGLQYATNLTRLNLTNNRIEEIGTGSTRFLPTSLTELYLADNANDSTADVLALGSGGTSYLSHMTGLTKLNLAGNDIAALGTGATTSYLPTSLTHLSLSRNSLTDTLTTFDPTPAMPNSGDESLRGPADSAAVLRHLATLTSLEVLNVSHNSIVSINAVENLTALTDLVINSNKIADFSPLVRNSENSGLGTGDEVWLGSNNFGVSVPVSTGELGLRDRIDNSALDADAVSSRLGRDILVSYPGFYDSYASLLMANGVTLYSTFGEIADIPDSELRSLLRGTLARFFLTASWESALNAAIAEAATSVGFINPYPGATRLSATQVLNAYAGEPLTIPLLKELRGLDASADDRGFFVSNLTGLEHCTNLETLLLHNAYITPADYEIIGRLTQLKWLDLSNQADLYETRGEPPVLEFLSNLRELRTLDLSSNDIGDITPILDKTVADGLPHLYRLEELDLRSNNLVGISSDIADLPNLRVLYLGDNLLQLTKTFVADEEITLRPYLTHSHLWTHNAFMTSALQTLANRPNGLITDILIPKSIEFVEPEYVYGQNGLVHIKVTFNMPVAYNETSAALYRGRPYLVLNVDGEVAVADDRERLRIPNQDFVPGFDDTEEVGVAYIAHPAHYILPDVLEITRLIDPNDPNRPAISKPISLHTGQELTGDALNRVWYTRPRGDLPKEARVDLGDTVDFGYFLPSGRIPDDVTVEYMGASPLVYYSPEITTLASPSRIGADGYTVAIINELREQRKLPRDNEIEIYLLTKDWFEDSPRMEKPVILTPPTVQMSRASGETGTATGEEFNVEIAFSTPLDGPSAAALASKISLEEEVVGVTIGTPTRPGEPTAYAPETWTLPIFVAAGASGDVTVTLDPAGLRDVASPGNPVAAEGSTLSITVPVNRPAAPVAPGESVTDADPVSVGASLEFPIVFEEDGVTYEGTEKPYITIYVGEQEQANERHAVWAREEDVNSTRVTFEYQIGVGDIASEVSLKPEEGIAIPRGTTFVSETVRIVGQEPPASGPGEAPPPPTQPSGGGGPDPGQPAAGSPQISTPVERTRVSLTTAFARPTVIKRSVQVLGVVYLPEEEETKADASGVPRSPVVFNELGNGSGDSNDWLEFRNVTGAAVSLKDYELSVVQNGEKKDTSLIVFPDVSVPANGLLLITNSDPTADGNRLAGGDNVATSEVETKGSSHLYLANSGLSLPDDGKFLLILRKSKEKLGMNEAFVDVAGGGGSDTDAFIREQAGEYDTHVWPLQVREAPGADTEDALGSGKVWQRAKADIVGYHKDAWAEAAFTGIGYDRAVSKSAATAGTPGYPNGALKTEASTPKGSITISEVMFDSGGGKLPQWVELYNKSQTEAINLNRWRLELQNVNSEDLVGRPIVTLTLGEKVIQPNQTLLIVSGDARASSSARLPADRVYNLFKLHEKNLRIKKPQDTFLSAVGFYLKLSDRNGTKIDEVGNTDGNRRTDDAPSWALPVSPEEGVRSSLIRRYTKGTSVAEDGMERGGWVLASNVKRFVADKELHWGHADDIGTPGYRAGGPLPVELSSFSVKRTEAGAVVLTWTTESEVDNAGFNLRRSEKRDSGFTLLNPALIAGAGTTGERSAYTWTDTSAKPGVEYYYRIEEVAFDGGPVTLVTRFLPGPVSASNRMLTTFGAVKSRD